MTHPKPDRSNYTPNHIKTPENDQIDIGWNEGFMSDGRPYRIGCWAQDQSTCVTVFMSAEGLETYSRAQFVELLEADRFHALFGWLQVDEVLDPKPGSTPLPAWARDHPHARHTYPGRNASYVAKSSLSAPGVCAELPGAGTFSRMHDELILTSQRSREGRSPRQSHWSLPRCFLPEPDPRLTYHRAPKRWSPDPSDANHVLLELVHRGQEFVFDASDCPGAVNWTVGIIEKYGGRPSAWRSG